MLRGDIAWCRCVHVVIVCTFYREFWKWPFLLPRKFDYNLIRVKRWFWNLYGMKSTSSLQGVLCRVQINVWKSDFCHRLVTHIDSLFIVSVKTAAFTEYPGWCGLPVRRSYSARGNDKRDTRYYRLCFACDAFYQSCCDILKDLYFCLNLDGLFVRPEVPVYSVKIMMERVRPSVCTPPERVFTQQYQCWSM